MTKRLQFAWIVTTPHAFWAVLVVLYCGLAAALILQVPTVQSLPHWAWTITDRGTRLPVVLAVGFIFSVAALAVERWFRLSWDRGRLRVAAGASLLSALAVLFQLDLALAEGRGLEPLRQVAVRPSYAELTRVASRPLAVRDVIARYDDVVDTAIGPGYLRTKPPGTLLVYVGLARLANRLPMSLSRAPAAHVMEYLTHEHYRLVSLLVFVSPLLSCLVLLPLLWLGRETGLGAYAHWPAMAYVFAAPTTLVVMQVDQVIYPVLVAVVWLFAAYAAQAERWKGWACAAGVATWLATFISFSLIPAMALAPVIAAIAGARPRRVLMVFAAQVAAVLLLSGVAYVALDYNAGTRFGLALQHLGARGAHVEWTWDRLLFYGIANLAEFFYWLGPALAALFAVACVRSVSRLRDRSARQERRDLLPLTTGLLLILTAFSGTSKGGTAQAWIFFVPALALCLPQAIESVAPRRRVLAFRTTLVSSAVWTCLIKVYQDFF